jgi:MOSC domain-containing protein YiiM
VSAAPAVSAGATGAVGRVRSLNVSGGGVPKRPVPEATVTVNGLRGDVQGDLRYHGGPERAASLFSLDVIEGLRAEGHPVEPGSTGENVTVAGIDWGLVVPGTRFEFEGGVVLEVTRYCTPCGKIRASFADGNVHRIHQEDHPGESRVYARVLAEGKVREGEALRVVSKLK